MGFAAIALMAGSNVMNAAGAYEQGQAASNAAAYNAQVATNNAAIATQNAQFAGAEGEANAGAASLNNASQVGAIKAAQGANGVDVNTGSDVNVRASQAELGQVNALNIRANAARQAYGYLTQSQQFTSQSQLDTAQSKQDKIGGELGAVSSLLGGSGNAAMNFSSFQNSNGIPTNDIPSGGGNGVSYGDSYFSAAGAA